MNIPPEAEDLQRRLALGPSDADAMHRLAHLYREAGHMDLAALHYRRAGDLAPASPVPLSNLSAVSKMRGDFVAAQDAARQALARQPDHAPALLALGAALMDAGDFDGAAHMGRLTLAVLPEAAEAHNNLANALVAQRDPAVALTHFARALTLRPNYAEAIYNRALARLLIGDLSGGWGDYEWRWRRRWPAQRGFVQPQWAGEDLAGRTILLHAEQGHGDTLQFARYAPMVAARGGRVVLEVQKSLLRLMRSLPGVERVIAYGEPLPDFDLHCPLMSLPYAFRTDLGTIPAAGPYVAPTQNDVARWAARLPDRVGLRVGLVWAGDPRPHTPAAAAVDRRRSLSLAQFAPLSEIPGITLVSLQLGPPANEEPPPGLQIVDPMQEVRDFADTAAIIANLDLVISADTAVAHLAGALGRPVWILSRFDGCWRWLIDRSDSPWYPTARLFRQCTPGDWRPVLAEVADHLRRAAQHVDG